MGGKFGKRTGRENGGVGDLSQLRMDSNRGGCWKLGGFRKELVNLN